MAGFDDPAFYGDRRAAVYDDHNGHADPGRAVEFLLAWPGTVVGASCRRVQTVRDGSQFIW